RCEEPKRRSSVGTANSGVPKNTMRIGLLPAARALELADAPHDLVALHPAQPIQEELAVEVIQFVLKRARQQAVALNGAGDPLPIECAYYCAPGAHDGSRESGHAQTSLVF